MVYFLGTSSMRILKKSHMKSTVTSLHLKNVKEKAKRSIALTCMSGLTSPMTYVKNPVAYIVPSRTSCWIIRPPIGHIRRPVNAYLLTVPQCAIILSHLCLLVMQSNHFILCISLQCRWILHGHHVVFTLLCLQEKDHKDCQGTIHILKQTGKTMAVLPA